VLTSELIDRTRAASEADGGWLGSDAHRHLIEEFASGRLSREVSVVWLDPGSRSYKDSDGQIAMERPMAVPDDRDVPRIHGEMVLHEVLHEIYTDHLGAADFTERLAACPKRLRPLGTQLFNWLEDARVAEQVHDHEPENDEYVDELYELSADQIELRYRLQHRKRPWSSHPRSTFAQLEAALGYRILIGEAPSPVSRVVSEILEAAGPIIDEAVLSPDTNGARNGALRILTLIEPRLSRLN
jgi:hypothetical protein